MPNINSSVPSLPTCEIETPLLYAGFDKISSHNHSKHILDINTHKKHFPKLREWS
jgi:hypothetical protein